MRENEIEDKLADGKFKSDLELTLLKAWKGRCYLRWSLVIGERAFAAAEKVADKESQLYLLVLAALCEGNVPFHHTCSRVLVRGFKRPD
ncbi:hypothetical protein ACJMK2_013329 [Sinanodonta woodiana]|uniref:Uncharacterized protein n=1 Tax=Sinanodonta woodiana TaxID=1069815 RepID=A0ABD3V0G6_SINWO